jgi:CheY-like chemotaxis protein
MVTSPGRQVLIVEDDALIALELESIFRDEGYEVVGPVGSVSGALACLARHRGLDGAVLDVSLDTEDVFSVADALAAARTPFLFLTGHADARLPARHTMRPVIRKPYVASILVAQLAEIIAGTGEATAG